MANLQVPRGENVLDANGTFQPYWTALFTILVKRFNAANAVVPVAAPDAAAAPGAYNQAHIQTIVAELNEAKAQINALLAALG